MHEFHLPIGQDAVDADIAVTVDWRSDRPLQMIYSPSHQVAITRSGDYRAAVSYEGKGTTDFRLYAGGAAGDVDVSLLTYKATSEDGYFLLIASPKLESDARPVAKDVILVLDLSGSMSGEKFEQAKAAARFVLQSLGAEDRFGIVGFHSTTVSYADQLAPATEKQAGIDYVDRMQLGGATNIGEAMSVSQRMAGAVPDGRPQVILLLTDGQPTAGMQDPDKIVAAVKGQATSSQRIFTYGVGYDVHTVLLDAMAQDNRGISQYVKPGDNLEEAVASFWRKAGQPVLTDLTIDWGGIKVEEIYPNPMPDLYLGGSNRGGRALSKRWRGRYHPVRQGERTEPLVPVRRPDLHPGPNHPRLHSAVVGTAKDRLPAGRVASESEQPGDDRRSHPVEPALRRDYALHLILRG